MTKQSILLKALTWQALGLLSMTLIGYFVAGDWRIGGVVALISAAISFVLFLFHEWVWNRALGQ